MNFPDCVSLTPECGAFTRLVVVWLCLLVWHLFKSPGGGER